MKEIIEEFSEREAKEMLLAIVEICKEEIDTKRFVDVFSKELKEHEKELNEGVNAKPLNRLNVLIVKTYERGLKNGIKVMQEGLLKAISRGYDIIKSSSKEVEL